VPTDVERNSKGWEGGKNPARSKVRPTKTVATVHHDGTVTATGPEAATAKREAEASVAKVKKVVRATKTEEHNAAIAKKLNPSNSRAGRIVRKTARELRIPHAESHTQHTKGIGIPSPSDLLDAAKSVVKTAEVGEASGGKIIRSAAEDEAKNLVKVAKKNLNPSKLPEPAHAPSADELQAFATIAGTGVGAGDAAGITEKGAAKAVQSASDLSTAAKELPRSLVTKVKEAPASGVKAVKETPQKTRELPGKVEHAVTTPEGRRAAAKGAGKTAVKHPIKTGVPAAAIVPPGVIPGDASERARALLTGLARAVTHPGDMATATAHGVLGAFTAPLAVTASAIESAKQGNIGPLTEELGTLAGGVEELGKKLISGNPEEVEQTFRHELGVTPFIPAGAVGRALKDSDRVDSALGSVRGKVEGHRSAKRDALIADVQKAEKEGSFVSAKHREKIDKLAPVEDTRRGTPYVGKKLGTFREKQRARHTVSRVVSRTEQRGSYAAKGWAKQISKALKKAKFDHKGEDTVADAQRILNKYGIPLDETGTNFVRMLHDSYPELKPGDVPAGVHLDRHSTKWLLDHPDALKDPAVKKAVELFDKQAEKVGTSDRNRYLGVVNSIINPLRKAEGKRPILLPEERVTKATSDLMDELVKGRDPVKDPWTRKEVLDYAKELHGPEGDALRRKIESSLVDENGNKLMLPPEHGGAEHGVATTRSVAWTPEHEAEFVKEAQGEIRGRGLREPAAYVGDELPDALKGNKDSVTHSVGIPLNKIWPSRGEAAMSGNAISDFEHFIHKSVEAPRHRASLVQGIDELVEHGSRKIEGKRAFTDDVARRLENEHKVPPGTTWVRIAALKNFIKEHPGSTSDDVRRAIEEESAHVPTATEELKRDVNAMQFQKGEKLVPMDEHYINEFLAHMKPVEGVTKVASKATRLASRMILNSPAFAAIQAVQEGVPMAAALSRDVRHIPEALKNLRAASELDPDELAAFKAASGSSAGLFGVPSAKELSADGYLDPVRMTAPKPAWQAVWHLVNGKVLGGFDRSRAGLMRELGMEARVIGDLNRASKGFNVWRHSTNNLFKDMENAAKVMKGMTPEERHAYISEHPELQDRIQKSADGMAGNWNSFTVFEKHFAPLTLFYTFQRYSALWMLYHFPLDHPVVATAMTLLGQVNAKELQKLAAEKGSEPNILDYTIPVYSKGNGEKNVLPAGKRAFPGLSTIQTAGVTGKPAQLIGELPPWLAVPVEAATGKNSYTGRDVEENLLTFMGKQALNLNPAARLFLGLTGSRSAASEAFHAQDPLSEWRSVVDPYIGQTGEQYGNTKALEKNFATKYGEGNIPSAFDSKAVQRVLFENPDGHVDPKKLQAVIKQIHESESASNEVKKAEREATGEQTGGLSPEQEEALKEIEEAWTTGPNVEGESESSNPFSKALSESKSSSAVNPFSKALSESASGGAKPNPFSAALAK
jgi:hypothetical protein